jgi:glycosyltransferase involved in cell wall biosynthesis
MAVAQENGRPRISVVIPCRDQSGELALCLRGLQLQQTDFPYEVVLVDSARDPLVAAVARKFGAVRLIRSGSGLPPGEARNLGVLNSKADWLAFLDADCIPGRFWIQQACTSLEAGHKICGGPVLDLRPNHPIAWADNRLQFADFQAGRPAGPAGYFPGANLVMPRSIFDELGGFVGDNSTGEDTLMTSNAHERFPAGMFFNPDLIVHHHGRSSWNGLRQHQWWLGYRRSCSRLHLDRSYAWLARYRILSGLVMLRRLGYISLRTLQYDPAGLLRLALFFPWIAAGLLAWTSGFYSGSRVQRSS